MKPPPRFVLSGDAMEGIARITGRELHHMRDVMRLGVGAAVVLLGQGGFEYHGRVAGFEPDAAIISLDAAYRAQQNKEADSRRLILAAALIRGPRMDFLVEKAAELNAAELWPLVCARSLIPGVSDQRLERWRRLSTTAAKQSLSGRAMEIRPAIGVAAMVRQVPTEAVAITCTPGAEPLGMLMRRAAPRIAVLACGPEGDFDVDEVAAMRAAGFVPAGLAGNRLRSETAALAALSIAAAALDELGWRS
jgi:16S rRNA (uracil1498-N3)-methyltransferase